MFWTAPNHLLPFDRYAVDYNGVKVRCATLMSASRLACDRARSTGRSVEVIGPNGSMIAVARCGDDGVPVLYWRNRGLEVLLCGIGVTSLLACAACCVAVLSRLA